MRNQDLGPPVWGISSFFPTSSRAWQSRRKVSGRLDACAGLLLQLRFPRQGALGAGIACWVWRLAPPFSGLAWDTRSPSEKPLDQQGTTEASLETAEYYSQTTGPIAYFPCPE